MKVAPLNPVKMAVDRFNIVGKLDDYASEMIRELAPSIYKLTDYNPITIAQKGDLLMVNSGVKTSVLNLKQMESHNDIMKMITKNVHENARYNDTGRKIEYII
jgi:hypothetical protein